MCLICVGSWKLLSPRQDISSSDPMLTYCWIVLLYTCVRKLSVGTGPLLPVQTFFFCLQFFPSPGQRRMWELLNDSDRRVNYTPPPHQRGPCAPIESNSKFLPAILGKNKWNSPSEVSFVGVWIPFFVIVSPSPSVSECSICGLMHAPPVNYSLDSCMPYSFPLLLPFSFHVSFFIEALLATPFWNFCRSRYFFSFSFVFGVPGLHFSLVFVNISFRAPNVNV